jgi:hypothetical protein
LDRLTITFQVNYRVHAIRRNMSATYPTWIRIGGRIAHANMQPLLEAIADAGVSIQPGGVPFTPDQAAELLAAMHENVLWLCDAQCTQGKFPELERACRHLGLSYTRFKGAAEGFEVELVDWRPEMKDPLVRVGTSADWDRILIDIAIIRHALSLLYSGQVQQAILVLRQTCPSVTPLPPFEIV